MQAGRRFPGHVFAVGEEPDPRFTLANERTFLAWIRTALALIGGGVAVDAVALPLPVPIRLAIALVLLAGGLVVPLLAWLDWAASERAMRLRQPLPASVMSLPLALGVVSVAVLVVIGIVLR